MSLKPAAYRETFLRPGCLTAYRQIQEQTMKRFFVLAAAGLLTACSTSQVDLSPIPGSITYKGQPHTRLKNAPVGSRIPHEFRNQFGERISETYVIEPDRSLRIIDRHRIDGPFDD
jgi:hypothetical protein